MICSNSDLARRTLADNRFGYTESDLLAVELPRRTAEPISALCAALLAAEINIHYVYPLLILPRGPALAMHVEDHTLAAQLLIRKGFTLIGESDL